MLLVRDRRSCCCHLHGDLLTAAGRCGSRRTGCGTSPTSAIEATDSMGQTGWQRLTKVELPMAKRTIIVGINQTTMAALSMATIAAFINGPGLGQPVRRGPERAACRGRLRPGDLHRVDGDHAGPGDHRRQRARARSSAAAQARDTAAPTQRVPAPGSRGDDRLRLHVAGTYVFAAKPWESSLGDKLSEAVQTGSTGSRTTGPVRTSSVSDGFTAAIINKLEYVLAGSPWWSSLRWASLRSRSSSAGGVPVSQR